MLFYFFVVLIMAGVLIYIGFFENAEIFQKRQDREYHLVEEYQCREIEDTSTAVGVKKEYSWTLEQIAPGDTCLAFYVVHQYVKVYLDDELLYSLTLREKNRVGTTTGSNHVIIPLYEEDAGKEIRIEVIPVYEGFKDREISFFIGSRLQICLDRFKADFPQVVISILVILVGVMYIAMAVYSILRKKYDFDLLVLGGFSIMIGLWKVTDMRFSPFMLPNHPTLLFYISVVMLILGAVPLMKLVQYRRERQNPHVFNLCCLILTLVCLVQILLQLTGMRDLRETLFITHISYIVLAILILATFCYDCFLDRREKVKRKRKNLFFICIVGVLLDVSAFYIKGNSSGLLFTLTAFLIYTIVTGIHKIREYKNQEQRFMEQEEELASNRIMIMMSQIQPHFLYNSLNSIYYLCKKDPEAARQAISDFSDYLRGNLESLKRTTPIPFETELEHIKVYLALEKMRFDEELNIVYDIETTAFSVPALTVQPLVENAVKHGVGKALNGGTVTIKTKEYQEYFEVRICDDGVGYNQKAMKEDGKTHIGIENVRKRLWKMSRATLEIVGEEGKGTTAVIRLPKGDENYDNYSCR